MKKEKVMVLESIGLFPKIIGWLSFLPWIGVFFSLIAIMLGLASEGKKEGAKRLTIIGIIGFVYNLILYALLVFLVFGKEVPLAS